MAEVGCSECEWQRNLTPRDIPVRCPECGGVVERVGEPQVLDSEDTKTDKI